MYATRIKTTRDLRNNFAEIQKLLEEHDQVVITRNGKGSAVVIPFEDYAKYEEYLHERYVLDKLDEVSAHLDRPETVYQSHEDVWKGLAAQWDAET